jgi:hypothetical protein
MLTLHFNKGHKKAFAISILNLYSVALLWVVSGAIAFKYTFVLISDIFSFIVTAAFTLIAALLAQNRNPINLYLEFRDVIISKSMIFISVYLSLILFLGQRGDNGVNFQELSILTFSIISMSFIMTFLFKVLHAEKWYKEKLNDDHTHFLS